jgi:6-phosphogluconolactonase
MQRKRSSLSRIALSVVALGALVVSYSPSMKAQDRQGVSFVYVMSNKSPNNSVIQYLRAQNGSLLWVREVLTGGSGTGATGVDPLGSQDSLVLSGDGHLLLAVNAASNDVSVLQLVNGRLILRDKERSGGIFPNSVALFGDLVYVLNTKGSSPHINGFRLDPHGLLHTIPGSRVNLPAGSGGANDIRFAEDGTKLLVTVSGTNQILVFEVADSGVAGVPTPQMSAGDSPFGIRFGRNGVAIVTEAAGSVSSYSFTPTDMLEVISAAVSDTQTASCWISLNRSATNAYVSNTGSGTISSYQIDGSGNLTLMNAVAANTGGAPIDSSLSRDSKFMYVLDSAQGRIVILKVNAGSLTQIGSVSPLPTSIQGIAAQ